MATTESATTRSNKVGLPTLTAMVVGSMVGAGVFSLPRRFGTATGVFGAIIAWTVAGAGMLMLAFVFQSLAIRKPELDAGVYAYAKAGFGEYVGFNSAFGYWARVRRQHLLLGLHHDHHGRAFPALGKGDTVLAMLASSIAVWMFSFLIRRGVKEAAAINRIVTVAKIVPIVLFIVLARRLQGRGVRRQLLGRRRGTRELVFDQVRATMLITVFVFLGIEGASVYSRYREEARGRGAGHGDRLPERARHLRAGHDGLLRRAAPRADRRRSPAVDGGRAGGGRGARGERRSSASA